MRVTDVITRDHDTVHRLFLSLERTADPSAQRELLEQIVAELDAHATAEEEVVYPALRQVSRRIDDAEAAHEHVRMLITALESVEPGSQAFVERVLQLKQSVLSHAAEEENGMLLEAGRLPPDELERLGAAMEQAEMSAKAGRREAA
jgi:hemerythrin superfamily protein